MRSTALFALAAASTLAFAENTNQLAAIDSLIDGETGVNTDFKASAKGSFSASDKIGSNVVSSSQKMAAHGDVHAFATAGESSHLAARQDADFKASAQGSFSAEGSIDAQAQSTEPKGHLIAIPFGDSTSDLAVRQVAGLKDSAEGSLSASASASASASGSIDGQETQPEQEKSAIVVPIDDFSNLFSRQAVQQVYGQCGGGSYSGPTNCASGSNCYTRDSTYSQCLPTVQQAYGQCGGTSYFGTSACVTGSTCQQLRSDFSQCM